MTMIDKRMIRAFLSNNTFALAGVSRSRQGFGYKILQHMIDRGYEILPIHPEMQEIDGMPCYPSLAALPKAVDGLILVVPPEQSEDILQQADIIGIRRVWIQPGAESEEVIAYCEERCFEAIYGGPCLLVMA